MTFWNGLIGLILVCILTIVGNVLVILSVYRERSLHSATYYYLVSLSIADLCVGLIVIPLAIFFELNEMNSWKSLCHFWHITDVCASTASILALCIISIDRYQAIQSAWRYSQSFLARHSSLVIAFIWFCSACIAVPSVLILGQRNSSKAKEINDCQFPSDRIFVLMSSLISFYVPLIIMVVVYSKMLIYSQRQMKAFRQGYKHTKVVNNHIHPRRLFPFPFHLRKRNLSVSSSSTKSSANDTEQITLRIHRGNTQQSSSSSSVNGSHSTHRSSSVTVVLWDRVRHFRSNRRWSRFTHEHKAAKVLGIVMGVFIACWLPFFLFHSLNALFHLPISSNVQQKLFRLFTYLGYTNSALNFFVYVLTSREFRLAFRKLLCPRGYIRRSLFKHYQQHHHQQAQLQHLINRVKTTSPI